MQAEPSGVVNIGESVDFEIQILFTAGKPSKYWS